jgi:enoyl-CoA hydratase/carnithine racemase
MPFVSLGLVPEYASSLVLPALIGHVKAAEKLMLGEPFTGSDAVDCGIANAVLPAGEVVNHARRMAERFNALAPGAVADTKRLMRAPQRARIREVMAAEGVLFGQRLRSPEAMEAFQAFFQKRKPDFSKFCRRACATGCTAASHPCSAFRCCRRRCAGCSGRRPNC